MFGRYQVRVLLVMLVIAANFILPFIFIFQQISPTTTTTTTLEIKPEQRVSEEIESRPVEFRFDLLEKLKKYSPKPLMDSIVNRTTPMLVPNFLSSMQCHMRKFEQLEKDLSFWRHASTALDESLFIEPKYHPTFVIYDQQMYVVQKFKNHKLSWPERMAADLVYTVLKTVKLNNVIFSVDGSDGRVRYLVDAYPTLVATKSVFGKEFLIPNYHDISRFLRHSYSYDFLPVAKPNQTTQEFWSNRQNIAFWRGSNTGPRFDNIRHSIFPRYRAAAISKLYPQYLDAGFARISDIPKEYDSMVMSRYGLKDNINYHDTFKKYNYYLTLDGMTSAWRVSNVIGSSLVALKQESIFIEHYYANLKNHVHFIEVKDDLSNLVEEIELLNKNQDKAISIVNNALEFSSTHLNLEGMLCYMYELLQGMSAMQLHIDHAKYAIANTTYAQYLHK